MIRFQFILLIIALCFACADDNSTSAPVNSLQLKSVLAGSYSLNGMSPNENVPIDRLFTFNFSNELDPTTIAPSITLVKSSDNSGIPLDIDLLNNNTSFTADHTILENNQLYTLNISNQIKGSKGATFDGATFNFKTENGELKLLSIDVGNKDLNSSGTVSDVSLPLAIEIQFSQKLSPSTAFSDFIELTSVTGKPNLLFELANDDRQLNITSNDKIYNLKRYDFAISNNLKSAEGLQFGGFSKSFYTQIDSTYKFPEISDEALLTKIQEQTFKYFWDFAHPVSGLARERNSSGNTVTIGGSGFGVMSLLVGIERGFITRQEGVNRLEKIVDFLGEADRFHGAWPHWINGETGKVIPFSADDDGADLVETAFMIQGLLTAREYLNSGNAQEMVIKDKITTLWEDVEWDWFTQGGQNVLYWHWSPNFGWQKNHKIKGWNEALIIYVLAVSSPSHAIDAGVYNQGWASNGGMKNGNDYYGISLPLGPDRGGPLFFAHYSFLGLDPQNLEDQYANYWEQNVNHTLINRAYCIQNPLHYIGYGVTNWGLTASDNQDGYSAHSPTNDQGVITPTAAISSIPYTPEESMAAIHHFYYLMGDKLWGEYGFYDAFNITANWYANSYLAIDQGPIIIMIENYRTQLLWDHFMSNPEIASGLDKLGFTSY